MTKANSRPMKSKFASAIAVAAVLLALQACGTDNDSSATSEDATQRVEVLLDAVDETILGQQFVYPTDGSTQVSVSIVTLQPGEETGWHHHNTPLVGYILEGTLTVNYGDDGTRTYETGDALVEAIDVSHNGSTEGDARVQILVVNVGSEGIDNTAAE
jgi:quercetin dioxygenase-like cupin family protein